ncbi:hypothetical protein [Streptomyces chartreusis]|uniref:hypothetical protein n=1 Tax=Streptomyces chartreusis TaxID=1969 RepID=UPI00363E386E
MSRPKVVLVGVGDADTDLMAKAARSSEQLEVTAMTRIGLDYGAPTMAYRLKVTPHTRGTQELVARDESADVQFALNATSPKAQQRRSNALVGHDKHLVDQTSSATGQTVDLGASPAAVVTCGSRIPLPMAAALSAGASSPTPRSWPRFRCIQVTLAPQIRSGLLRPPHPWMMSAALGGKRNIVLTNEDGS